MIIARRRHKHRSSGANRPSDVAVTVNINAGFNLSFIRWQLTAWLNGVQGISSLSCVTGDSDLESSAVYTVAPFLFKSLPGRSNRSLPRLPLHMHAEPIIPIFLISNFYIRVCHPKSLTLTQLRSYELFRHINSEVFWGLLSFPLLRDVFPHQLARGIPLKQGVP